ncbi:SseB family protein [Curtobacterium flaccumfaciens pv. oortii]|uniref:SseB family protein n=1 Tax=Curtobacterium flaccumfaciens TaxID=2035 RepID=UPI001BDEB8B5|nr:SseB family protein [Curtobacterium flaccumfaciens]MBT1623493.1 SseB family protein [Curtobacterium flaccumfaciens pv. oortii]
MSNDETNGSAFGRGVDKAPPTAPAELRRRMAASPAGFLRSAAWVPWKPSGTPEAGSVAHVMIRDKPFVPIFTDPAELAAGLPEAEGRPVPMSELVTALPEEFGIVVDPTSAAEANFLHADVLAQMRVQMQGGVPTSDG